jgi:hypothetical protein
MSRTQNSFLKNQRAKQKKQTRDAKLERKHDKKNKPPENIHDMSNLTRPEELGFLPEEKYPAQSSKIKNFARKIIKKEEGGKDDAKTEKK